MPTQTTSFEVGDAVTVIGREGTDINGIQGLVVAIEAVDHPDGVIRVNFSERYREAVNYSSEKMYDPKGSMRFKPEELRKDACLDWVDRAYRDWPPSRDCAHWGHYEPETPFVPGETVCQVSGCSEKAVIRGYMNIHGVFCAIDFCPEHRDRYNSHGSDSLPID